MAGGRRGDLRTLAPPPCTLTGRPVEPVREHGPWMVAPRLADPEGSLQRSIDIQQHSTKDPVNKQRQ
eukprot:2254431-Alexandrium_andersonii.AAC.1